VMTDAAAPPVPAPKPTPVINNFLPPTTFTPFGASQAIRKLEAAGLPGSDEMSQSLLLGLRTGAEVVRLQKEAQAKASSRALVGRDDVLHVLHQHRSLFLGLRMGEELTDNSDVETLMGLVPYASRGCIVSSERKSKDKDKKRSSRRQSSTSSSKQVNVALA
jgi:hypothetical protein